MRARTRGAAAAARRRAAAQRRLRRRLHLVDQLVSDVQQLVGGERRRLLHEVDRAGVERRQHLFASLAGDADDDDRHRLPRHLRADEGDAVHLRHVQVAGDDIGPQLGHQLEGLGAVARGAHHLDERRALQHLLDDLADVGRVVNDEDAGKIGHRWPLGELRV